MLLRVSGETYQAQAYVFRLSFSAHSSPPRLHSSQGIPKESPWKEPPIFIPHRTVELLASVPSAFFTGSSASQPPWVSVTAGAVAGLGAFSFNHLTVTPAQRASIARAPSQRESQIVAADRLRFWTPSISQQHLGGLGALRGGKHRLEKKSRRGT